MHTMYNANIFFCFLNIAILSVTSDELAEKINKLPKYNDIVHRKIEEDYLSTINEMKNYLKNDKRCNEIVTVLEEELKKTIKYEITYINILILTLYCQIPINFDVEKYIEQQKENYDEYIKKELIDNNKKTIINFYLDCLKNKITIIDEIVTDSKKPECYAWKKIYINKDSELYDCMKENIHKLLFFDAKLTKLSETYEINEYENRLCKNNIREFKAYIDKCINEDEQLISTK